MRQEIDKQRRDETLSAARTEPEISDNMKIRGNCNALKMEAGKPFGITRIGVRKMSIITVGGHEVMRNLSERSDQTLMNIDLYADYL